jgi:hypothetical protein
MGGLKYVMMDCARNSDVASGHKQSEVKAQLGYYITQILSSED